MASVNKVILIGNIGRDPEIRAFPNGGQIVTVSVATTDKWKDKQTGEAKEHTEWHRVVFNNRLAEIAAQYLRKGSQVYVEGSLHTRKWADASGVEKYSTEIRAELMQMLGSRQGGSGHADGYEGDGGAPAPRRAPETAPAPRPRTAPHPQAAPMAPPPRGNSGFEGMDDDIPF